MDNLNEKYEDWIKLLNEMFENKTITKYEYDEYKKMDMEYDEEKDSIELFKQLYSERQPIKCSMVLIDIYNAYPNSFRKTVLLNDCFPSPFKFEYNDKVHDFSILILKRAINLANRRNYSKVFIDELNQLYLSLCFFHKNNYVTNQKLNSSEFMQYSLSEQIRMISIYLQDLSRIEEINNEKNINKKDYITGMEGIISDQKGDENENVMVSSEGRLEAFIEIFDTLVRYLYYKKKSDFEKEIIQEHGDITYAKVPSFEMIVYVADQRNLLIDLWGKFIYSEWNINLNEENNQKFVTFSPKLKKEYKEFMIANYRRHYTMLSNMSVLLEHGDFPQLKKQKSDFSKRINKDKIETLFSFSKEEYFQSLEIYQLVVESYKSNMHPYYLNLKFHELKLEDIFSVFKFLNVLAARYKEDIYKDFDPNNDAWYKYLSPIIPIRYFIKSLTDVYDFSIKYSKKLIDTFTFGPFIKGESDIFSKPLILINDEHIIFSPVLIEQMNLERIIELLISNYDVNIQQIGIDFENRIRSILSSFSGIKVNTNKIEFFASDQKNVEFDFIGMFNDHLLLIEFKAMTTPYSDKEHIKRKKIF